MIPQDEAIEARVDGKIAYNKGEDRDSCPFPGGTPECRFWLMGWDGRKKDVEDGF